MPTLRYRRVFVLVSLAIVASAASCDSGESLDQAGDFCVEESCAKGLICHRYHCMAPADTAAYDQAKDESYRREREERLIAAREKEARLLRESGREVAVAVEEPIAGDVSKKPGKAPGAAPEALAAGAIRVVHTKGLAPIFAACRDDERLISGGCTIRNSDAAITDSFPSHFSAHDTLAARWNCDGDANIGDEDMEAYALCARVVVGKRGGGGGKQ